MTITTETTAADYVKHLTQAIMQPILEEMKINRSQLETLLLDTYADLKNKKGAVHSAVYGYQASPFVMSKLQMIFNNIFNR